MKNYKMTNGTITATFPAKDIQDARNEVLKFADCSKETLIEELEERIDFTRVNRDANGNPRYVCHYSALITEDDKDKAKEQARNSNRLFVDFEYEIALKKAKKIGGRKFHNKQYGGGIVFQSYNIQNTERRIFELLETGK